MTTGNILTFHAPLGRRDCLMAPHRLTECFQHVGIVTDQAELHGHVQKVRDIGLPLISVTSGDAHEPDISTLAPHQMPTTPPRRTT
jgi:hypothetical protein